MARTPLFSNSSNCPLGRSSVQPLRTKRSLHFQEYLQRSLPVHTVFQTFRFVSPQNATCYYATSPSNTESTIRCHCGSVFLEVTALLQPLNISGMLCWLQLESIASREASDGGPGYITSIEALNTSASQQSQASQPTGTQVAAVPAHLPALTVQASTAGSLVVYGEANIVTLDVCSASGAFVCKDAVKLSAETLWMHRSLGWPEFPIS